MNKKPQLGLGLRRKDMWLQQGVAGAVCAGDVCRKPRSWIVRDQGMA